MPTRALPRCCSSPRTKATSARSATRTRRGSTKHSRGSRCPNCNGVRLRRPARASNAGVERNRGHGFARRSRFTSRLDVAARRAYCLSVVRVRHRQCNQRQREKRRHAIEGVEGRQIVQHDLEPGPRSEEHTSELQSRLHLVCRLLLEKKKKKTINTTRLHRHTKQHTHLTPHRRRARHK